MDVQATTSHELVQPENQAAIDSLRRLSATRDALARMLEGQPRLAESDVDGARRVIEALPGFWSAPDAASGTARNVALGQHLASVMKESAALRALDGTLRRKAASLAADITASAAAHRPPSGIHIHELMLGDVAHAGSLVAVADSQPDVALLFTTHGGWEAFDSVERLLQSTRRRLLESVDAADGTGLENDEFPEAKLQGTVGIREIVGPVFTTLANRITEVQRARVASAADDHVIDVDQAGAATRLGDRVRYELSPSSLVDVVAIEALREAYLLEATVAARLVSVPSHVRDAWYEARDEYNDTLAVASMIRSVGGIQWPQTLHGFASRDIAARLAALGIDEAPDAITVELDGIRLLPTPLQTLEPFPGPATPRRMSLVDLACQNISRFSLETLHVTGADGASLDDRLSPGILRDMVRTLDIANRYQAHVDERLRQGKGGALARKLTMAVQAAHMRLQAQEARLSYYLPTEPRSFVDDRDERGFGWVMAALDAPVGQRRVDKHEIAVSQVTYKQVPLDGILVFSSRASQSAPRVVMYTPGAPDGLTFREFESRQDAAKRFLYHPAFREYLLDRLPGEFATVSRNGVTRQFAGDRLAHWVLGASKNAAYTLTAEPMSEREVQGDFLAAAYDATVDKYRRDTRLLARSASDADNDALFDHVRGRLDRGHAGTLAASMLTEIPASLARMAQASWRFYDHVKAGDSGEAFIAFTEGYVNGLNLVGPPFIGGRHVAGAIVRSRGVTGGLANTPVHMTPVVPRFDQRYAARHLRNPGRPDIEGIFRARGQAYIEQDGTFFHVRYDAGYGHWRLAPSQGVMDAQFTGPVITQMDGRWIYGHDVGLRGGMRRIRQRLNRLVMRDEAPAGPRAAVDEPAAPPHALPATPPSPPLRLPRAMEPYRAEITAAVTDNPSARVLLQTDGNLVYDIPQRSAFIVDPHLHADIAELSAHQRRVLLHEIDTRFPLAGERAHVLAIRGWTQPGGRRVPSSPPSPGVAPGTSIQSPAISSSGDSLVPEMRSLNAGQQARWDEALAAARNAPRSPRRASIDASADTVVETLPATEAVPADEWPRHLWYFSDRQFQSRRLPGPYFDAVTLGDDAAWIDTGGGMRSYPVSALPPETPISRLSEMVGTSPVQQAGQRDPLAYAIHIDMARLHNANLAGRAVLGGPGFELRRRLLSNGEYQYTLQSRGRIHVPSNYIISIERRGGQPRRMPSPSN